MSPDDLLNAISAIEAKENSRLGPQQIMEQLGRLENIDQTIDVCMEAQIRARVRGARSVFEQQLIEYCIALVGKLSEMAGRLHQAGLDPHSSGGNGAAIVTPPPEPDAPARPQPYYPPQAATAPPHVGIPPVAALEQRLPRHGTPREFAAALGVVTPTLLKWIKENEFPFKKKGNRYRLTREDVMAWLHATGKINTISH